MMNLHFYHKNRFEYKDELQLYDIEKLQNKNRALGKNNHKV